MYTVTIYPKDNPEDCEVYRARWASTDDAKFDKEPLVCIKMLDEQGVEDELHADPRTHNVVINAFNWDE